MSKLLRSNALDLEPGVFTWKDPRKIAESLKHSAEASERRKGTPFQSAMSMLNFYTSTTLESTSTPHRETSSSTRRTSFENSSAVTEEGQRARIILMNQHLPTRNT